MKIYIKKLPKPAGLGWSNGYNWCFVKDFGDFKWYLLQKRYKDCKYFFMHFKELPVKEQYYEVRNWVKSKENRLEQKAIAKALGEEYSPIIDGRKLAS